ncbi:CCHC-type domain-containing protein [Nephila pilipes]|uniref:CCHC-type domain-containing protein n=1 Tax=Nephila pilipes TaxID=299642 RepID=A0A8X6NB07_NEPPI|nr:CCHC-type domain-containing protein [Nephila pilipes]
MPLDVTRMGTYRGIAKRLSQIRKTKPRPSWGGAKAAFSKKSPCRRIENFRTEWKAKWTVLRRIDSWCPMFDVSGYRCEHLEKNEILTGGEEIPLFSANIEFPKLCSVFAKEKTVIPARSEYLIRGVTKASEHFRYAVTNSLSQISEKGVLVAATLVDLKKETIPVRILNMDNKPKTIDKGAIIASYEPVVDIVAHPQEFSGEQPIQSILENLERRSANSATKIAKLQLWQFNFWLWTL